MQLENFYVIEIVMGNYGDWHVGDPHDPNEICVDVDGETIGNVANNQYTLIKLVKSATEIKNTKLICVGV